MKRTSAKELLPIIQAYAEGKTIQFFSMDKGWEDKEYLSFTEEPYLYRIKPEPKYRPFKSVEECWNEMQKHKPVGWLKSKLETKTYNSYEISDFSDWERRFNAYTFADGTPYGIKEE